MLFSECFASKFSKQMTHGEEARDSLMLSNRMVVHMGMRTDINTS